MAITAFQSEKEFQRTLFLYVYVRCAIAWLSLSLSLFLFVCQLSKSARLPPASAGSFRIPRATPLRKLRESRTDVPGMKDRNSSGPYVAYIGTSGEKNNFAGLVCQRRSLRVLRRFSPVLTSSSECQLEWKRKQRNCETRRISNGVYFFFSPPHVFARN